MPKITKYECDGCGQEPDAKKNFLMLSGMITSFSDKGQLQQNVIEKYFCHVCSREILDTIHKLNEKSNDSNGK